MTTSSTASAGGPPPPAPDAHSFTRPPRWKSVVPFAGAALILLSLSGDDGFVTCPFRRCTGGYCPGCGASRGFGALARLDIRRAFEQYPAFPFLITLLLVIIRPQLLPNRIRQPVIVVSGLAVSVIWVIRLALGDIPRPTGLWPAI